MIGTLNVELGDQPEQLRLEIKQRSAETIDIALPDYSVSWVDHAAEPVSAVQDMLHDAWRRGVFLGRRLAFDAGRLAETVGKLVGLARGEYEQAERMARCAPPRPPASLSAPWTLGGSTLHLAAAAGVAVNRCRICHGAGSVGQAALDGKPDEFAPLRRCVSCHGTGEAGGKVSGQEVTCRHCNRYLREHDAQERCVPFNAETFSVDMQQVLEAVAPAVRPAPGGVQAQGTIGNGGSIIPKVAPHVMDKDSLFKAQAAIMFATAVDNETALKLAGELGVARVRDLLGPVPVGPPAGAGPATVAAYAFAEAWNQKVRDVVQSAFPATTLQQDTEQAVEMSVQAMTDSILSAPIVRELELERHTQGHYADRIKAGPQEQADALEAAYWRFDTLRSKGDGAGPMAERDAFKTAARDLILRVMRREVAWTEPAALDPAPPSVEDVIAKWAESDTDTHSAEVWQEIQQALTMDGKEIRNLPERWPGQAIVMPPGSVDRELHDLADVLDQTHRGGLSLSMSTRGGATMQLAYMTPEQAKEKHERAMAAIKPDPCCANCGEVEEEHGPSGACPASCGETFEPITIERKVDRLSDRLTELEGIVTGWPHSDRGLEGVVAELRTETENQSVTLRELASMVNHLPDVDRRLSLTEGEIKLARSDIAAVVRDLGLRVRDARDLDDRLTKLTAHVASNARRMEADVTELGRDQSKDGNRTTALESGVTALCGRLAALEIAINGCYDRQGPGIEARLAKLEGYVSHNADLGDQDRARIETIETALSRVVPPERIRITLVGETGRKPERMSKLAAGLDCWSANTCARQVAVGQRWRVPLGFRIEIPVGWFGSVVGRSGGFEREGLLVHLGIVDADYRGEVHALFQNNGREAYTIQPGHRIAQLVILPVAMLDLVVVGALSDTERGERGFGHTGDR